ncbi:hypothetical protein [Marinifaba aquimaris]|nr:hypothetical protein [Marinifaba aquimaris]
MPLLLAFGAGFIVSTSLSKPVKYLAIAGAGYVVYQKYAKGTLSV